MQEMDLDERAKMNVMRLEGTKKWIPGGADGFKDLIDALRDK